MSGTVLAQKFIVQFDCDEHNEHQQMVMIRHSLKQLELTNESYNVC